MNNDLEQAIRLALEPLTQERALSICSACGAWRDSTLDPEHECRPMEIPGEDHDAKRRAKSYCVS
ncbi:MAG: hypothetical protein OEY86_00980 [Nitrospira sp.]|nr:hypothetical protein [Nitrospira sp.]